MRKKEIYFPGIDIEATGKRIGQIIDESGLHDKELGKMLGISVQAINKWRHGRNIPDIENLYILSRILCVKVDDFLVPRKETAETMRLTVSVFCRLRAYYSILSHYHAKDMNHSTGAAVRTP